MKFLAARYLHRNSAGRHFYGTENEIWAGFEPVANTELGANYEPLLRVVFSEAKKKDLMEKIYCSVRSKKLHKMKMRKKSLRFRYKFQILCAS